MHQGTIVETRVLEWSPSLERDTQQSRVRFVAAARGTDAVPGVLTIRDHRASQRGRSTRLRFPATLERLRSQRTASSLLFTHDMTRS
jgi:hypothetical protein